MIVIISLLGFPLNLLLDYIQSKVDKVNHFISVVFRLIIALVVLIQEPSGLIFLAGVYSFWDLATGWMFGGNIQYIGKTSKWDKLQRKSGIPLFILMCLKVFVGVSLISYYIYYV